MSQINTPKTVTFLRNNASTIETVENFIYQATGNHIRFADAMDEETHDALVNSLPVLSELQANLSQASPERVDNDNYDVIWDTLTELLPKWRASIIFYSNVYNAYHQNETEYFDELAKDEDANIAVVGQRLSKYFDFSNYWQNILEENSCNSSSANEVCIDAQDNYERNLFSLEGSPQITRAIFTAYDDTVYSTAMLIFPKVQALIEEMSDS